MNAPSSLPTAVPPPAFGSAIAFLFSCPEDRRPGIALAEALCDALPGFAAHLDAMAAHAGGLATGVAVARALEDLGVRGAFAAGYDEGELAALAFAGAFDDSALGALSATRSALLEEAGAGGAMLSLAASSDDADALVRGVPGVISIAYVNAPAETVVSGDLGAITAVEARAADQGVRATRLDARCALHSPLVQSASAAWRTALVRADVRAPERVVASNVSGRPYATAAEVRELLARQLVAPVSWARTITELWNRGARVFVEVGPGRALTDLCARILGDREHVAIAIDPGEADARAYLAECLARLGVKYVEARGRRDEQATRALLEANRGAIEAFFAQQQHVADIAARGDAAERTAVLEAIVKANERAMRDYLAAQERVMRGLGTAA